MMMTFGSRFEALRTHTTLVVTISEEKLLYESNLKVIMARVNAATSLLKWAKGESNPAFHDMVGKLYDVVLMWSTVQKQFAEQCLGFSKALNNVLQVEQGLDAIRKEHKKSKDKIDGLQKQIDVCKRKSDMGKLAELEDQIFKYSSEEEELAAELQVKFIKGEIFKAKVIKAALLDLMDAYADNADKVKSLCNASTTVIQFLPDVPNHFSADRKESDIQRTIAMSQQAVSKVAMDLGLAESMHSTENRPLADLLAERTAASSPPSSPIFAKKDMKIPPDLIAQPQQVELRPQNEAKNHPEAKNQQESKAKKRLSKLPSAFAANFHRPKKKNKNKIKSSVSEEIDDDSDNFVILAHPNISPPPVPTTEHQPNFTNQPPSVPAPEPPVRDLQPDLSNQPPRVPAPEPPARDLQLDLIYEPPNVPALEPPRDPSIPQPIFQSLAHQQADLSKSSPHLPTQQRPTTPQRPHYARRRSQSSTNVIENLKHTRDKELMASALAAELSGNSEDDYEDPGYIKPNFYPDLKSQLVRCSSDSSAHPRSKIPDYREPADRYEFPWIDVSSRTSSISQSSDHIYDTPYDAVLNPTNATPPTKPLPTTPQFAAPPKPKRADINDAYYINTNEVEKLLKEVYGEIEAAEIVKPAVKKRALKKIQDEKMMQNNSEAGRCSQRDEYEENLQKSQSNEVPFSNENIPRKKEARPRFSDGNTVDLYDQSSGTESQANGSQITAREIQAAAEQNIPRERPKVPLRTKNKPERKVNDSPEQKLHNPGQQPGISNSPDISSPTADAAKDIPSVMQAKGRDGKILRPRVPPKPLYSPQ